MTIQIGLAGAPLSSHGHQPPTPLPAPAGFSSNVFVNGQPVHHVGNTMIIHPIPGTFPPIPHLPPDVIIEGYTTVLCNGTPLAKFLSKTQHGSMVMQGSRNVFVRDVNIATWIAGSDGGATAPPTPAE